MNEQIELFLYKLIKAQNDKGDIYVSERPERLAKLVSNELGVIVQEAELMDVIRQMKREFKIGFKYFGQYIMIKTASHTPKEFQ